MQRLERTTRDTEKTCYRDGIKNVEQCTVGGGYGRGRPYGGEKSEGSTNERGDDKLRMGYIRLDPQQNVDPIIRIL